jgi:hypothetical protein
MPLIYRRLWIYQLSNIAGLAFRGMGVSIRAGGFHLCLAASLKGVSNPIAIAVSDEVLEVITLAARWPPEGYVTYFGRPRTVAFSDIRRALYREQLISG